MKLTLALLLAWLAIYCSSGRSSNGHGNVVLSLPPSLIANAAALRQQLQQPEFDTDSETETEAAAEAASKARRWKKDARVLFDSLGGGSNTHDVAHSKPVAAGKAQHSLQQKTVRQEAGGDDDVTELELEQPQPADLNRKPPLNDNVDVGNDGEYDLEPELEAGTATATETGSETAAKQSMPQEITTRLHAVDTLRYSTPYKYWARHCNNDKNCPQEYYKAMMAASPSPHSSRNKAAAMHRLHQLSTLSRQEPPLDANQRHAEVLDDNDTKDDNSDADYDEDINNEIFMLLTGEQDLIKFLHWAMELLYPSFDQLGDATAYYHPDMFIWKKLNLSGHLEPPLIVEEPRYIIVRREQLKEGLVDQAHFEDDPFIPPRGRKHNSPDLDALLQRYETFVPNRGKRDKVKDLFKYDDLFFPNRGKKTRQLFKVDDPFYPNRGKKLKLRDIYNIDDPFFPNRGKRQRLDNVQAPTGPAWSWSRWGKLKRKLSSVPQLVANEINGAAAPAASAAATSRWPQRMSTHKINGYDQSVKPSMSAAVAMTAADTLNAATMEQHAGGHGADEGALRWRRLAMGATANRLAANRLHSTRSMSTNSQLRQRQQRQQQRLMPHQAQLRYIGNPSMRQQVKTYRQLLQQLPQKRQLQADPRETQLTRFGSANPESNTEQDMVMDLDMDMDMNASNANGIDIDYANFPN